MSESASTGAPARLQGDIQQELERREWAEPGDTVMAEYICVLISNGNPREKLQAELEDLVGSDFEVSFLDWLFSQSAKPAPPAPAAPVEEAAASSTAPAAPPAAQPPTGPAAGSRIFSSAVEGTKRKVELIDDEHNKRRLLDRPLGAAPAGPRAWQNQNQQQNQNQFGNRNEGGRSLADRLAPTRGGRGGGPGGMNVRGSANGRMGGPGMGPGSRPPFGGPQGPGGPGGFMPGQQEMMMQMMAMQANMAHMAQQMTMMAQEKSTGRPPRPPPSNKLPPGIKLGNHAVSTAPPKANVGPIPDKPSSTALCKFGVGCTNSRCTFSHPSPAADEKSGMVLSEEPCEAGKECKDAECVKSHVSPAAVLGASAGPTRVLCKFQNCTNPTCQYRHEDAEGNFIPPPALSKASTAVATSESADKQDGEAVNPLDQPLADSSSGSKMCRYAERCTRADCKFSHPASRPTPRGGAPASRGGRGGRTGGGGDAIGGGGMSASKKFSAPASSATASAPLNPAAGEFKPAAVASADKDLEVTM